LYYWWLNFQREQDKMALTACMRKLIVILNALIRHRTPWTLPATYGT